MLFSTSGNCDYTRDNQACVVIAEITATPRVDPNHHHALSRHQSKGSDQANRDKQVQDHQGHPNLEKSESDQNYKAKEHDML